MNVVVMLSSLVMLGSLLPAARPARPPVPPGFQGTLTDPVSALPWTPASRPAYLVPATDPLFGTRVTRISGDPGTPVGPGLGVWGTNARHVYSRQQPWNSDGTLLTIENRAGRATRSPLVLDGETYRPKYTPCDAFDNYEYRWHPSPRYPTVQIAVNRAGTELMWFDVATCTKLRSWTLPFPADYGIGSGEGNVSEDGRYAVISDDSRMVVVDMDPRGPGLPPYPHARIGPVYTFVPCSLRVGDPTFCPNGNISISPSGRYIDLKFGSGGAPCDVTCDLHRIFSVDSGLVIRPHTMAGSSLRCGPFATRPNGWTFPLKHADMARDPFDGDEDVLIGGRSCPGSRLGRVLKVRLRDGKVTELTDGANESHFMHASARNTRRPGWVYVTYARGSANVGRRFAGEIVAVKLDGSGEVQRFGRYHSTGKPYRAEGHGVPSPDGRRVMFASDWADGCTSGCGSEGVFGAYVLDARDAPGNRPASAAGKPPARPEGAGKR
jgi:hypothetical protein